MESIDYKERRVVVKLDDESALLPTGGALKGRSLIFTNEYRSTEYQIGEIEHIGDDCYKIELIGNDFICGYDNCQKLISFFDINIVQADRDLYKREYYKGMYLLKVGAEEGGLITDAGSDGSTFFLSTTSEIDLEEGDTFHIYDFGVGTEFTIDTVASLNRDFETKKSLFSSTSRLQDTWSLETTSSIILTLSPKGRVYGSTRKVDRGKGYLKR